MKRNMFIIAALIAVLLFSCSNRTPEPPAEIPPTETTPVAPTVYRTVSVKLAEGDTKEFKVADGTEWSFPEIAAKEDGTYAAFALDESGMEKPLELPVKVTGDLSFDIVWTDAEFTIDPDTGYIKCTSVPSGAVAIPYMVHGTKVKGIDNEAFPDITVKNIVIPHWIETIEANAFYRSKGITDIRIPSSVTVIGEAGLWLTECSKITVEYDGNMKDWDDMWTYEFSGKIEFEGNVIVQDDMAFIHVRDEDGTDALSFLTFTNRDGSITEALIPGEINGLKVISTEKGACGSMKNLKKVTFQEGLRHLGAWAFYATPVEEVNLPEGLISIGDGVFRQHTEIPVLTIPSTVTEIGDETFRYLDSTQKVIIKSWQNQQKWQWHYIAAQIERPDTFEQAPYTYATWILDDGTEGLMIAAYDKTVEPNSSLALPSSVTWTPEGGTEKTAPVVWIGKDAFSGSDITSVTIPSTVKGLGKNAFYNCTALMSVTLPDGLESIGEDAFYNARWNGITIPASVKYIGESAFRELPAESTITIKGSDAITGWDNEWLKGAKGKVVYDTTHTDENGVIYAPTGTRDGKSGWKVIGAKEGATELRPAAKIGERPVVMIEAYAFKNNATIETVVIPDSVTDIGTEAFFDCQTLTDLDLGKGVIYIGEKAFYNCIKLEGVTLRKNMTELQHRIFAHSGIKTLTIENGLTSLPYEGFSGCKELASVVIPDSITDVITSCFYGCTSLSSVTLGNCTELIRGSAFNGCTALKSITIPASVKEIYNNAFMNSGLETVVFAAGEDGRCDIDFVGTNAFSNTKIKNLVLPPGFDTRIENYNDEIFANCHELVSVTFSAGFRQWPKYMFSGCEKLTTVKLPNDLEKLSEGAFKGTAALQSITLPPTLKECEKNVFNGSGLKSVTFETNADGSLAMTRLASNMFEASGLESVILPDAMTGTGWEVFKDCKALKTVVMSKNMDIVGQSMFSGCTALESVTLPDNPQNIYSEAFSGCTSIAEIRIPASVKKIYENAFTGWTDQQSIVFADETSYSRFSSQLKGCNAILKYLDENGETVVPVPVP